MCLGAVARVVTWSGDGALLVDGQPQPEVEVRTAPTQGHFKRGKRGPRSRFDPDKDDDVE